MEGQRLQISMAGLDCVPNCIFHHKLHLQMGAEQRSKKVKRTFKNSEPFKQFSLFFPLANREFEKAAMFCESNSTLIPLTFVLAFYVSHVVSRWWAQWNAIPWPDGLAFKINSYCSGLVSICISCTCSNLVRLTKGVILFLFLVTIIFSRV